MLRKGVFLIIVEHEIHETVIAFKPFVLAVDLEEIIVKQVESRFNETLITFPKITAFPKVFAHAMIDAVQ